MWMCVRGWMSGGRWRGGSEGVILFLHLTTSDFFNSFHITYQLVLFHSPAHSPNAHTKGEDYRKSGKTKLITRGISTSQCCLKCNYMGLELWLRPGRLQISHWQTCSQCKMWLPLKMTAGERVLVRTRILVSCHSCPLERKLERRGSLNKVLLTQHDFYSLIFLEICFLVA